ncbi:hypothetical protein, partial [Streptomyces sp. NPDC014685]|uniref:hypothetical protein n=1 Tax=Streptomyces sp. NPDC014685 TaxID=3364881 RepID=UPI0036FCB9E0
GYNLPTNRHQTDTGTETRQKITPEPRRWIEAKSADTAPARPGTAHGICKPCFSPCDEHAHALA